MKVVVIGSPFSGKSYLLDKLEENGIKIFNADKFIHEQYKVGNKGYELIKENYGEEYVNESEVDRNKLSYKVMDNLEKLNSLIHPLIIDEINNGDYQVMELPILMTSDMKIKFDKTIHVVCSKETINKRAEYISPFVSSMIDWWFNQNIKSDYVINTDNGIDKEEIEKILNLFN